MQQPHRILHTMLRVDDLARSVDFYTRHLGMKLLRQRDYPEGRFTLAFLGYGPEDTHPVLELTHNWEPRDYVRGDAFGHLALAVKDVRTFCAQLKTQGVPLLREPGPMRFDAGEVIAFIADPDGYPIELVERD